MADYNEIICEAIDTIVSARLQGLKYDITKVCRIEDDSNKDQGKYLVSENNSISYEAFSTDKNLSKGASVQVTIPNGDYNMQKTIIGRITSNNSPFIYNSPFDFMVAMPGASVELTTPFSILANEKKEKEDEKKEKIISPSFKKIGEINKLENQELNGFDRLGVSAQFLTRLKAYKIIGGEYGIGLKIFHQNGENLIKLTNADMNENSFASSIYFTAEQVFDISKIKGIKRIEVYLYQDGDFITSEGLYDYGDKEPSDNIFVKDIKLIFGYNASDFQEEKITLFTKDSSFFQYNDADLTKELAVRWVHFVTENNKKKIRILSDQDILDPDSDEFQLNWYQYVKDLDDEKEDEYGGNNWLQIKSIDSYYEGVKCKVILDKEKQEEHFKVVGIWKRKNNIQTFESEILTFSNKITQVDDKTKSIITDLQISCADGSEGKYLLYNQNGSIKDTSKGVGNIRTFKLLYKNKDIYSVFSNGIDYIKWEVPADNEKTMITISNPTDTSIKIENINNDSYSITETEFSKDKTIGQLSYCIKNFWQSNCSNNIIKCSLSANGIIYEAQKEIVFGRLPTSGTNYNLQLQFKNNMNAVSIDSDDGINVEAVLFDNNEEKIILKNPNDIKWSWWKQPAENYLVQSPKGEVVNIKFNKNKFQEVPKDNYYILQASLNIKNAFEEDLNLQSFLPIPIKNDNSYATFSGAKKILYNASGVPEYDTGPYILKDNNGKEIVCLIKINNDEQTFENQDQIKDYYPSLKNYKDRQYALSASPVYLRDVSNKVCVYAEINEKVVWAQPILITQSENDFALTTQWNGTLTLDEENGKILTTVINAGRKNEDNTFSGVLLGDIQSNINGEQITNTGVYGFDHGKMVYSLKDDGTATFGVKGKGQIRLDGNEGTIVSGSWNDNPGKETGMKIDLDDGILKINDEGKNRIFISPGNTGENSYFSVNSNNGNTLINISNENYYLQSDGYNANLFNPIGTKIDLSSGLINISSDYGSLSLQPKSPFFSVRAKNKLLLQMGEEGYFLQSMDFSEKVDETLPSDGKTYYYDKDGEKVFFKIVGEEKEYYFVDSGEKVSFELNSEEKKRLIKANYEQYINIDFTNINIDDWIAENKEILGDKWDSIIQNNIIAKKVYYENTLLPISAIGQGMKINLEDGNIIGYNLYIKATNANNQSLIIDGTADAEKFPFSIGEGFKVNWDGHLYCKEISIGNDDNNCAININNNFVVNKDGTGYWIGGKIGGAAAAAVNALSALDVSPTIIESKISSVDTDESDKAILIYKDGKIQQGYTLNALVDYLKKELRSD